MKRGNIMYAFQYELTKADYVDFNLCHAKHSKQFKKMLLIYRILGPIIILIGGYYITGYKDVMGIVIFSIAAILWAIFFPKTHFKSMERNVKKLIDEGKDTSLFELRKVQIDEKGITEESIEEGIFKRWNKIVKIETSMDNVFLYTSDLDALIVPRKIIGSDQAVQGLIEFITDQYMK